MRTRSRSRRRFLIAAGILAGTVLVAGCGGSQPTTPHIVSLDRAANVTAATGLKMHVSFKEDVGSPSVVFNATGSFTPKKNQGTMLMTMKAPASGAGTAPMRVVIANGTIYEQLPSELASQIPGHNRWMSLKLSQLNTLGQLPGLFPFIKESLIFDNPSQYLDFLSAAAAGSVKQLGQAKVNGVQTTHYQTSIDISKLPTATPAEDHQAAAQLSLVLKGRLHASALPVNVYVDRKNLIRRLQTTVRSTFGSHPVSLAITENITRYGSQPAPTPPSPSNTTALLSLVHGLSANSG